MIQKTIGDVLSDIAGKYPARPAVIDACGSLTYRALDEQTDELARGLVTQGVKYGSRVGVWAEDCGDTLQYFYAVWKLGAVLVPLCLGYTAQELCGCVQAADLNFLLVGKGRDDPAAREAVASLPDSVRVLWINEAETTKQLRHAAKKVSGAVWETCRHAVCPDSADTILFTSGTTGAARPVVSVHLARVNLMVEQARMLDATERDIFCSALPTYHCFALTANVLAAMSVGACVCYPADRHGATILKTVEKHRCTILTAVPTLFSVLLRRMREGYYDISSLRAGLIGGSTYSPEFYRRLCRELGYPVLPSLGQTEATAAITAAFSTDSEELRMRSVGRFVPGIEGSIRDVETSRALPAGETGEICVRGYSVMRGYFRRPEDTAAVIDAEGWLHTGDLGKMDAEGNVYYIGRKKEIIIRGGENIAPSEIENLLLEDERVRLCKVIGVPDEHYIEAVCACVAPQGELRADDVYALLSGRLAAYKLPKYVLIMDALPMTPSGKIDGKKLKAMALERIAMQTPAWHEGEK